MTKVTLWSHEWEPDSLQGERSFTWFNGDIIVPLKFGENNSLTLENVTQGLKSGIESKAEDKSMYERGARKGINDEGPTQAEKDQEALEGLRNKSKKYRGSYSAMVFAFNSSLIQNILKKGRTFGIR